MNKRGAQTMAGVGLNWPIFQFTSSPREDPPCHNPQPFQPSGFFIRWAKAKLVKGWPGSTGS